MTEEATSQAEAAVAVEEEPAPTRSPWLPCFVAWLFPGAGHLLIGQYVSGAVFALVVLTTFVTGISLSGTVYAFDPEQPLSYLATVANLGAGPLDIWARLETYDAVRYRMPDSVNQKTQRERLLRLLRRRVAESSHAYGRTFLLTAGLMNLLLVMDVFDRCIGRKALRAPPGRLRSAAAGGGSGE